MSNIELEEIQIKATSSLLWSTIRSALIYLSTPVLTILLSYWLSPSDFGMITCGTIVIHLGTIFQNLGTAQFIIREQASDDSLLTSSLFWFNIILGGIVFCGIFFLAPYIANVFGSNNVSLIIRLMGIKIIITSLMNIPQALITSKYGFKKLANIQFFSVVVTIIITILLAVNSLGYYSMILGSLAGSIISLICTFHEAKWYPKWAISLVEIKRFWYFGLLVTIEAVEIWSLIQLDNGILGAKQGLSFTGLYSNGFNIAFFIVGFSIEPIIPIAFLSFSKLQKNIVLLRTAYLGYIQIIAAISLPIGFLFAFIAPYLVGLFLNPDWQPMIFVIQVFAIYAAFGNLWGLNSDLLKSINKPLRMSILYGLIILVALPIYFITSSFGIVPFTIGRASLILFLFPAHFLLIKHYFDISFKSYWMSIRKPIISVAIMSLAIYGFYTIVSFSNIPITKYLMLLGITLIGSFTYLLSLYVGDRALVMKILNIFCKVFKNRYGR